MSLHTLATASVLAIAPALTAAANAQEDPGGARIDMLLHEVRLLRETIGRQGAFRAHVQLLTGRLALQDERVARLEATADRLRSEAEEARRSNAGAVARLEAIRDARGSARQEEREYLEQELQSLSLYAKAEQSRVADLEARWAESLVELEAAESRFEELESYLDQLDRQLNKTTR